MTRIAGATHVGYKRQRNEDSFYVGTHLAAVADGMGGHVAGDVASQTAIAAVQMFDEERPVERLAESLGQAIHAASTAMQQQIIEQPEVAGMGTTLVALMWSQGRYALASIGDSRAYLLRDGRLTQLTDDHVYGRLMATAGRVPRLTDRLARFLDGRVDGRSPDLSVIDVRDGDRLLLCSDGLSSYVPHEEVQAALGVDKNPEQAADTLVGVALQYGGHDNVTVIVVDVPMQS